MRATLLCLLLAACAADSSSGPASIATGEVGAWQTGPALPTPRANHCSAAIDNWLLVIGGNHKDGDGFAATDEIHAAQLGDDGTLGPWQLAGHTPSAVTECAATSDGRTLYVIGGIYATEGDGGQVWTATLDDAGMLGALVPMGAVPANTSVISSEATVRDGALLVMNAAPNGTDAAAVAQSPVGALAWETRMWPVRRHNQAEYAITDKYVYMLGGYRNASEPTGDVFVSGVATTPLPVPVAFGEAIAVDDYVYVVGGRDHVFAAPATTHVFAAHADASGALGPWTQTELPIARTNHDLARVGDYLVVTGGAAQGPGDDQVLVARVRFPPAR